MSSDKLPKGTTHISIPRLHLASGGRFEATFHAFCYKDGVLMCYDTDNDNVYESWSVATRKFSKLPDIIAITPFPNLKALYEAICHNPYPSETHR